jgi:hypothetical protein
LNLKKFVPPDFRKARITFYKEFTPPPYVDNLAILKCEQ